MVPVHVKWYNIVTGGLCIGLRILELFELIVSVLHTFFVGLPVDCIVDVQNHYRGFHYVEPFRSSLECVTSFKSSIVGNHNRYPRIAM